MKQIVLWSLLWTAAAVGCGPLSAQAGTSNVGSQAMAGTFSDLFAAAPDCKAAADSSVAWGPAHQKTVDLLYQCRDQERRATEQLLAENRRVKAANAKVLAASRAVIIGLEFQLLLTSIQGDRCGG